MLLVQLQYLTFLSEHIVGGKQYVFTYFQSAVDAVEHGLSLWLPQLRNCSKSSAASAEDSSEVCICPW